MLNTNILLALLAYYVFNAAVGSMQKPKPESSAFYVWMFGFLQTLCANADRLAELRFGRVLDAANHPAFSCPRKDRFVGLPRCFLVEVDLRYNKCVTAIQL